MRYRLIMSLLLSGLLVFYAVPKLALHTNSLVGVFSITWMVFAFIVISGNILGLLYFTKRKQTRSSTKKIFQKKPERARQYH